MLQLSYYPTKTGFVKGFVDIKDNSSLFDKRRL